MREEVATAIEAGVEEALAMPMPDGATATDGVFADEPALLDDGRRRGAASATAAAAAPARPAGAA